jgi:hypothetical protein
MPNVAKRGNMGTIVISSSGLDLAWKKSRPALLSAPYSLEPDQTAQLQGSASEFDPRTGKDIPRRNAVPFGPRLLYLRARAPRERQSVQITDLLTGPQASAAIAAISKAHGLETKQVAAAVGALAPMLAQRIERNTLSRGGLADLVKALGDGHHEAYLQRPELIGSPAMVADGNDILCHILGGPEQSRSLAARAAGSSGLSEGLLKQLLPIIAAMLMGMLSKQTKGGLGDILSKLPGGLPGGGAPSNRGGGGDGGFGDIGDILKKIPGMPGSQQPQSVPQPRASRTDAPVPRGGYAGGDSPLPIPGDRIPGINDGAAPRNNPYGDLSDVIRGGGAAPGGGGPLGNVIRDILGGVLGFQSRGFIGWLIRLIVVRWGWGLVRSILGRILTGR